MQCVSVMKGVSYLKIAVQCVIVMKGVSYLINSCTICKSDEKLKLSKIIDVKYTMAKNNMTKEQLIIAKHFVKKLNIAQHEHHRQPID